MNPLAPVALPVPAGVLGVVGWPVNHSLSPPMQKAGLQALGLSWVYGAFAVPPDRLAEAVRGAAALGVLGLNVTMPHKEAALRLCHPDALALQVGAVNTLCFRGDRITGHNTDVAGLLGLCHEAGAALGSGRSALLLGVGGAARAAAVALRGAGVQVRLAARQLHGLPDEGAGSARVLDGSLRDPATGCGPPGSAPGPGAAVLRVAGEEIPVIPLSAAAVGAVLPTCDLLIDCTPRGLTGAPHPELDLRLLPAHAVVLDLVVRPTTALCAAAAARGLSSATGAAMLLHQGAAALGHFTGRPIGPDVVAAMRAALLSALSA